MCSARCSVKKFIKSKKFKKKTPQNKEFLDIVDGNLCKSGIYDIISKEEKNFEELRKTKIDMKTADACFQEIVEEALNDTSMFPQEVNKCLSEQVEGLLEENTKLKQSLKECEARLKGVQKYPPAMALHGRASDLAASKIVELTKRVRELTADLEVAKLRCRNVEASVFVNSLTKSNETQKQEEKDKRKDLNNSTEDDVKDLAEKLASTNLKLCEARNQCQQLKHEVKLAHKALTNEVGDNVSIQSVISGVSNWRGRAQQICNLQQRVAELTDKLNSLASGDKQPNINNMIAARQLEKELRAEHEKEVKEMKMQLDEKQRKFDASKARSRVLENTVSELKGRVATLLEKTTHDDQLIYALTTQLTAVSERTRDREQDGSINLEQYKTLEHELSQEKIRNSQLQNAICERDSKISTIEEKLKEVRNNKQEPENSDSSQATTKQNGEAVPTSQLGPDAVSIAAEAERVRLLELLAVTNKRLERERQSCTEAQDNLRHERHKAARLETKLAKQELDRIANRNNGYYSPQPSKVSVETVSEELKYKIELLEEEVLFLRSRLNTVEQEKQDDLREYTSLLEDARHKFLEAIKTLKVSS